MNDHDPLEAELRRLRPAPAPETFQQKLIAIADPPVPPARAAAGHAGWSDWLAAMLRPRRLAWVALPAAAGLLAVLFWWHRPAPAVVPPVQIAANDFVPDTITLSQEVLARYDGAIVQSPDGEVVRLTGYERVDSVILKDSRHGSVIERREPRREIIPVHLDIY